MLVVFNTVYHLQDAEINFVSKHLTLGWIILKCEGRSFQWKLHLYQQLRARIHEAICLEDLSCERNMRNCCLKMPVCTAPKMQFSTTADVLAKKNTALFPPDKIEQTTDWSDTNQTLSVISAGNLNPKTHG